jgi:hypothetical protein
MFILIGKKIWQIHPKVFFYCMTRKTVWFYRPLNQSQGVDLIIRLEQTKGPEPSEGVCLIELQRRARDKIEKREFPITKAGLKAIQEGVCWLREILLPDRKRARGPFPKIQHRCEDESGLVLFREIPASKGDDDMEIGYKIGDGAAFDYTFESFDELERFIRTLEGLVLARVASD